MRQWQHGAAARDALRVIPKRASVAANTPLIPLLAQRRALVRFPSITRYVDDTGTEQPVDWVAVDLDLIERYGAAFRSDWRQLRSSRRWLEQHRNRYAVQALNDGFAVLQRQARSIPGWRNSWIACCSATLGSPQAQDMTKTMPPTSELAGGSRRVLPRNRMIGQKAPFSRRSPRSADPW